MGELILSLLGEQALPLTEDPAYLSNQSSRAPAVAWAWGELYSPPPPPPLLLEATQQSPQWHECGKDSSITQAVGGRGRAGPVPLWLPHAFPPQLMASGMDVGGKRLLLA